jgi:hypothetical protein
MGRALATGFAPFSLGPLVVVQRNTNYDARVGKWPLSDKDLGALNGPAIGP